MAAWWADEVNENGFTRHSADKVKNALGVSIPVAIDTKGELDCTLNHERSVPNIVDSMPELHSSKAEHTITQPSAAEMEPGLSWTIGGAIDWAALEHTFWSSSEDAAGIFAFADSHGWEE